MDVLLSFTGFHDPYTMGLIGDEEQPGPILSLVAARAFDRIILFSTPATEKNTSETRKALESLYPKMVVDLKDLALSDPTDYFAILSGLRIHIRGIVENISHSNFFISIASGTPQMHACWVLLAASGEIPALILNVRPARFVRKGRPLISVVDVTSPDFPVVRSRVSPLDLGESAPADLDTAIAELGIVGDHPSMRRAFEIGAMLAPSSVPILLLGETGTGKELFARFVHRLSGRPKDRFVPINCAAIPKDLVESLLFGHKKGAFTGAITDQEGKFDVADGGTLFLDELGEMPFSAQGKLLRILQDGLIEPLGARDPHRVTVRIIAATNRDLRRAMREGQFREDLYYRLNVGEIQIPPLRERKSDIANIALQVLDRLNSTLKIPKRLSQAALTRLHSHPWPGNVRDLENVIERSVRLTRKEILEADDLMISEPVSYADPLAVLPEPAEGFFLDEYLSSVRKQLILRALDATKGNQSEAARLLGITPQAVNKFLKMMGGS